jgi:RHS repeat-associated protein
MTLATIESANGDISGGLIQAPTISLPKGGGAIRGLGEKFAANPVTGSATFSIPVPASPGRNGFGPQLALRYDSASGNSPFGFGWSLGLPSITRKTDKGLPRYRDDTDTFLISDAEDLVPVLSPTGEIDDDHESVPGYVIRRFQPRIEGTFARIERWTRDDGDVHWRSISADNVLSVFGKDETSRIFDPANHAHVFSWLICEARDDKGNAVVYEYRPEYGTDADLTLAHERQRGAPDDPSRTANRYISRIVYGNATTLLDTLTLRRPRLLSQESIDQTRWMFELVFDYGDPADASPDTVGPWTRRDDPFSRYRAGFEVRTYRLCHRILMLHTFPDDAAVGSRRLVRSLDLSYRTGSGSGPGYSFLAAATQRSYQRDEDAWHSRPLPPVDFEYSQAEVSDQVRDIDPATLQNLPVGLGSGYQWVDLNGEGLSGILTEQAGAWLYKPNLGDGPSGLSFGPSRPVVPQPAMAALNAGRQQLMDLQGNGALDLVDFHPPAAGFHERDQERGWTRFVPFASLPSLDWSDPNLRFVDLTGDGLADVLITESEVFTWHPSQAEEGFGPAALSAAPRDESAGPRVVFADSELCVYLADMSGDGLTDIVRIRNGQTCYWPNLGYNRWGSQVVMDGSPCFDQIDVFDQRRIRLADIDGSGTTDLIYLGRTGARLWLNRSGNAWSPPRDLPFPVATGNIGQIQVADLHGHGTTCLVWSSDLPGDARRPLRYLDLTGRTKPHLLTTMRNNLGAVTTVDYAASTTFYLRDQAAGTPWVTRLPFPVHCAEKITVTDLRRHTVFATTYSYHHGYFDGIEREFRGFGRVEQVDTQRFDEVSAANSGSPFVAADHKLYQPPVKTVTWFHTGIAADRSRILGLYEREYFPARWADRLPAGPDAFAEHILAQPEIEAAAPGLAADEWREAMRACKGMVLRQEVFELDVRALEDDREDKPIRLFSAAQHNCHIRLVQPRGPNRHAVFLVTEGEALTYHYELPLGGTQSLKPDPRIEHTLNLRFDRYGRPVQSVAAVYARREQHSGAGLTDQQLALIHAVQNGEQHLAYTETRFTDELTPPDTDTHRQPPPCEVRTYELTGINPPAGTRYFSPGLLRDYELSPALDTQATKPVGTLGYHEQPPDQAPYKRLVEHGATLYFKDDLSGPHDLGQTGRLGLAYEAYKLALTDALVDVVFTGAAGQGPTAAEARAALGRPGGRAGFLASGYQVDAAIHGAAAGAAAQAWWLRSGVADFADDAAEHFYLPERYLDPFGHETTLVHDDDRLYVRSSTDARGNTVTVAAFDHRVLAPARLKDANDNCTEAAFDIRGLPVATAVMGKVTDGKPETGDTVGELSFDQLNPDPSAVIQFFEAEALDEVQARRLLGQASTRFVYHFGESTDGWAATAAGACHIAREKHERDAPNDHPELGAGGIAIQAGFEYSDGAGQAFVTKARAEPDPAVADGPDRWIANGKTIVNNKGKPVLQYEPYFSPSGHRFEEPVEAGISPAVMFYDAAGRLVRTEFHDGTLSRAELSPWFSRSFDQNDTVLETGNSWYAERTAAAASTDDKRAARIAAQHANTPAEVHFDSLGRNVITITHNRAPSADDALVNIPLLDRPWLDERALTFTKLDAEGKPLWICDALGNLVMQYITPPKPSHTALYEQSQPDFSPAYNMPADAAPCYDIAGNLLFQHSMDAGDRWTLPDAAGQPMLAWDFNVRNTDDGTTTAERRLFEVRCDALRRPAEQWLTVNSDPAALIEAFSYADTTDFTSAAGLVDQAGLDDVKRRNLIGQAIRHYDPSGVATIERADTGGAVEEITRTLVADVAAPVVDWQVDDRTTLLKPETFVQITQHDALTRMTTLYQWHLETPGQPGHSDRVAVYVPAYDKRGTLQSETLHVQATKAPGPDGRPAFAPHPDATKNVQAVKRIGRDAKGQRLSLELGNGTSTRYTYDPDTFRLVHLYTRRDARFTADCAGDADAERPARPCGVQNLHYTYDAAGNITHIQDDAQQTIWFANQQVEPSNDYCYDALYRLIEAKGRENAAAVSAPPHPEGNWPTGSFPSPDSTRNYTQRYSYDRVGNVTRVRHIAITLPGQPDGSWTRDYAYAYADPAQLASNRLWQTWLGGDRTGAVTYRHDPHGSMLNLANTLPGQDMRWDWRDMLRAIDLGGGADVFYNYGIDKQRNRKVRKSNGNVTEDRIYLGGYELYRRYDGRGAVTEETESLHLFEGERRVLLVDDVLVADSQPGHNGLKVKKQTLSRYQYDNHLGSATAELDEAAQAISYEEFHPYGTSAYRILNSAAEAPAKRYRFTGMERDEESGLSYHGERYLSCSLGLWIAPDPAGISDGVNRWSYSRLNPIRFKDSNGRASSPFPTPVPFVGNVVGGFIRWWQSPSNLEQRVAEANRREAQAEAHRLELVQRDPDTLSLDEAIQLGFPTNDPTYGQDPFNQQYTTAVLSVISLNAAAPFVATAIPAMSQPFITVQAVAGAPLLETAMYPKWLSEPGEWPLGGAADRSELPQAPLIFAEESSVRSLAEMTDIARRAGIEMHPDMKLIVDDKMVDALAKRMGVDPALTDAAYAPQIRPGQVPGEVGFQDLFVESGEEEFIPVYIRARTLSSTERFVATVAHESHELTGLEDAAPFGERIPARKFQQTINARHDETPEIERAAVERLRNSGLRGGQN